MAKELNRVGVVGLELTREEVIDLIYQVRAVKRKAQCREVSSDIIDELATIAKSLNQIDAEITGVLDD